MHPGAITSHIDVAQITLYAFWIFFAGLIIYLRSEDRREGFPLQSDTAPYQRHSRFLGIPKPKTFLLANGETRVAPRDETSVPVTTARPIGGWPGAPLHPIGNPMLAGVGPGSYANRPGCARPHVRNRRARRSCRCVPTPPFPSPPKTRTRAA